MFDELQMAPPDPILGLTEAFKKDPNPGKINLGVGVYIDESGKTPIFATVKKAEALMLEREQSKSYLPMTGLPDFAAAVGEMVFGPSHEILRSRRAATAQTPGGTAALRVAGDFLKKIRPGAKLWVSDPTWANHLGVFTAAGFEIAKYPYYDAAGRSLDFAGMSAALAAVPPGDVVLLHGCCHNPTGVDPSPEQWAKIALLAAERKFLPLVDFAYQGFGDGLDEDAVGVRTLCAKVPELLIASSFSKNFGLYNERVGGLTVVAASAPAVEKAMSHLKLAIRQNYSNPPSHGGSIVATIWKDAVLRTEWEKELAVVRARIHEMRRLFAQTLKAKGVKRDFSFIVGQKGMFSFSGLGKEQVDALREKYAIYIVGDGRINVAGMTRGNMDRLTSAVAEVLAQRP